MGVRIMISCGCDADEPHHSCELDSDLSEVWFDDLGVLKKLGIATLPSVGELDEEESNDEFALVRIEPGAFLRWLDDVAAKRTSIRETFEAAGQPRRWNDQHFGSEEPNLRELADHCRSAKSPVEASHG